MGYGDSPYQSFSTFAGNPYLISFEKLHEEGLLSQSDLDLISPSNTNQIDFDSSDVWANKKLFTVDKNGKLKTMAGVPPDYFSPTGQLWGNPLYKWNEMKKDKFLWWRKRIEKIDYY